MRKLLQHLSSFARNSPTIPGSLMNGEPQMDYDRGRSTEPSNRNYLIQLWSEQLNHPDVGIQDDFFEAGGSSMQVIEMLMTVSDKFGKNIDFAEFFKEPCIRKLSELLET
jgi:acyl carrier protein